MDLLSCVLGDDRLRQAPVLMKAVHNSSVVQLL